MSRNNEKLRKIAVKYLVNPKIIFSKLRCLFSQTGGLCYMFW